MSTEERLQSYFAFSNDVISRVSDAAERQNKMTFSQLADMYGIGEGAIATTTDGRDRYEYLRIDPRGDHDTSKVRLLFSPFSVPADKNMAMRAMRLFEALPDQPLFVLGNAGFIGNRANRLSFEAMRRVGNGDLTPTVDPIFRVLSFLRTEVEQADLLGFSFGAEQAATATSRAANYGIQVKRAVYAEPAATQNRSLVKMSKDFFRSAKYLDSYVKGAESEPLEEARELADVGMVRYLGGLTRLTNIEISRALTKNTFMDRVSQALNVQKDVRATIAWGTESEITTQTIGDSIEELNSTLSIPRLFALRIAGMRHAGGDDIDLHAAIMLNGLI